MDRLKNAIKKILKEMSMTGGGTAGAKTTGGIGIGFSPATSFKKVKNIDETAYGTGNLGPGPKAGKDGVKDNYYVKAFGFKPVDRKKQAKSSKAIDYKDLWGKTYK